MPAAKACASVSPAPLVPSPKSHVVVTGDQTSNGVAETAAGVTLTSRNDGRGAVEGRELRGEAVDLGQRVAGEDRRGVAELVDVEARRVAERVAGEQRVDAAELPAGRSQRGVDAAGGGVADPDRAGAARGVDGHLRADVPGRARRRTRPARRRRTPPEGRDALCTRFWFSHTATAVLVPSTATCGRASTKLVTPRSSTVPKVPPALRAADWIEPPRCQIAVARPCASIATSGVFASAPAAERFSAAAGAVKFALAARVAAWMTDSPVALLAHTATALPRGSMATSGLQRGLARHREILDGAERAAGRADRGLGDEVGAVGARPHRHGLAGGVARPA